MIYEHFVATTIRHSSMLLLYKSVQEF